MSEIESPIRFPFLVEALFPAKILLTLPFLHCHQSFLLHNIRHLVKMKESSKLVMGASLVTVICLGAVLALLLVLLAELYCSLLRKRRLSGAATTTAPAATETGSVQSQHDLSGPFSSSAYSQGVLQAPRSLLFPNIEKEESSKLEHVHEIRIEEPEHSSHQHCIHASSPAQEVTVEEGRKSGATGGGGEHLVYISNPIYDNEAGRASGVDTPFETPDTSPSRLGISGSSSSSEDEKCESLPSALPMTPPLTPMKKLPEQACSVSLRDARSLGTSGSGSDSVNGPSSSSSGSPRTSPSW